MSHEAELLLRYTREKSEDAFAELVRRHIDLVYSVARRQVGGDAHLAEDVTQQVFIALAQKAESLSGRATLSGWLYRSTHFAASDMVRAERRRRAREQEVHTMQEISPSNSGGEIDWGKFRPTIDAAIAELGEGDRDAVSLRFFDGCSFAEIGARLRLTENAARMRVERALDKLHAVLARRGVTSTAAALASELAGQVGNTAPTTLAAAAAGTALVHATAASGLLTTALGSKIVAGIGVGLAVLGIGVAVVERNRAQKTAASLFAAEQQRHALALQMAEMNLRIQQATQRANDAEKDTGELLQAVGAASAHHTGQSGAQPLNRVAGSMEEDERLAYERAFQQETARRRVEEAKARAKVDDEVSRMDDTSKYHRLMELAREYVANCQFQNGLRTYNEAMAAKPRDVPVSDDIKELQAELSAQKAPVGVSLTSDGQTYVMIPGLRLLSKFQTTTLQVLPGNYELVGRRRGFQDVVIPLIVRAGMPPLSASVQCTIPAKQ